MKEIHDQTEIEEKMKEKFKGKYVKVYDTRIPHKPFVSWFGHDGITDLATAVSNEEFVFPPMIHPDIIKFFTYLEMHDEIRKLRQLRFNPHPPIIITCGVKVEKKWLHQCL